MKVRSWAIAVMATALVGCGIGRVVTAPVRYVFREPEPKPAANTSDVTHPGHPVTVAPPTSHRIASQKKLNSSSPQPSPRVVANTSLQTSPSSQQSASSLQFPVAKVVPGKPGLVFNPFNPNGGYIDVSGYPSGSKVKDPDSQQIFVVP